MNRDQVLAAHLLRTLARAQAAGHVTNLDTLSATLGVRRGDIRSTLSRLHREGHVDVAKMRVTWSGLALATALRGTKLPLLRPRATGPATIAA